MTHQIIDIRQRPELKSAAARWFHEKWQLPQEVYLESITAAAAEKVEIPRWYLVMQEEQIIGGCGVIENDFHDRKDLTPNLCALFVEKTFRKKGIAGQLLDFVCQDMAAAGNETLYLLTDHTAFYERYGWQFLCLVHEEGTSQEAWMYVHYQK